MSEHTHTHTHMHTHTLIHTHTETHTCTHTHTQVHTHIYIYIMHALIHVHTHTHMHTHTHTHTCTHTHLTLTYSWWCCSRVSRLFETWQTIDVPQGTPSIAPWLLAWIKKHSSPWNLVGSIVTVNSPSSLPVSDTVTRLSSNMTYLKSSSGTWRTKQQQKWHYETSFRSSPLQR